MIRGRTVVGTLRQRGADDGRAHTALGTVGLRPPGLPEDAILVVRRLADPLPGHLGRGSETGAWQRAAVASLTRARDGAARPAAGPVPTGAEAVLFDDWAQLLAALADDWISGQLAARWWWRELVRAAPPRQAVVRTWHGSAREAPAAMALLAERGQAASFAARLTAPEAASLTAEVARVWGAPAAAVSALTRPASLADPAVPAPANRRWTRTAPEAVAPELPAPARVLLGVGLTLARLPAIVAGTPFWDDVVGEVAPPSRTAKVRRSAVEPLETGRRTGERERGQAPSPACPERDPVADIVRGESADGPASMTYDPAAAARTGSPGAESLPPVPPDVAALVHPPGPAASGAPGPEPSARATAHLAPAPERQPVREDVGTEAVGLPDSADAIVVPQVQIRTELGGLLFLLNLAVDEGLYADFTRPATAGLPISPWALLDLVGPALLAVDDRDDRVWTLLASLAGRDGPPRLPRATRRWAHRLSGRWQATLADRLACDALSAGPLLIRLPARVRVTALRVDASFDLSALPIAVRMAGLDRDPGWFPACGRSITFGFA